MEPENNTSDPGPDPRIAAALSYLLPPLSGIFFILKEKENDFVRFHAHQSALFGMVSYILYWVSSISLPALLGFPVYKFVSAAAILMWMFLILKAFAGDEYELPYIGKIAREQSKK
ncbi:hypothetical protein A2473_01945 [candidate division WWE3 bacterium RIFOXYC2_FULL_42_13]|uniref:DUF4870 domain-containing protein n=1 Tax=candidate division WWE3 bacterium TaxID=2053526 RepID=A0A3D0ZQ09_UNCKA|nr:MAG: hypothetical protein A2245_03030 [candidate division WWE3 bacterium RIFOXYA2_FULL_43_12]OGC64238.1 MAG: hypothetical protein A2274_02995 [candidate division WWE3 bacterium RIFOXYA12_FULL_43_11]OGC72735.1 MAG: hypothetical protein A2337_00225 [candidate division WWE3 bacterium RIFOXYB2_FULL_43_9]OGC73787.1 MAG: hypothetical protein A2473_01945 [candidate division WWE3 bacterium RIFOXYC2_FULL_42_13]HBY10179.1 hypothetical protein [candidate division WWE3 bacterium]